MRARTRAGTGGRRSAYSWHRAARIATHRQPAARAIGRQGDPGSSRFYLSLEDDLLRIFGADRLKGLMDRIGMEDGVPIEHRWISKAIENAQKKVEAHNFDIRKHLLEYDDVMNNQREVVYHRRRELLSGAPLKDEILEMCDELIGALSFRMLKRIRIRPTGSGRRSRTASSNSSSSGPNFREIRKVCRAQWTLKTWWTSRSIGSSALYDQRETEFTEPVMRQIEKIVMLQTLDSLWKDHLLAMDHLKEGIGLRGYGQKNPLVEYQREGFEMFEAMMRVMQQDVVEKVFSVQVRREQDVAQIEQQQQRPQKVVMSHGEETVDQSAATVKREADKVGRNDACPCGSGKKYKRCHGK